MVLQKHTRQPHDFWNSGPENGSLCQLEEFFLKNKRRIKNIFWWKQVPPRRTQFTRRPLLAAKAGLCHLFSQCEQLIWWQCFVTMPGFCDVTWGLAGCSHWACSAALWFPRAAAVGGLQNSQIIARYQESTSNCLLIVLNWPVHSFLAYHSNLIIYRKATIKLPHTDRLR